jgi:hypothetical protein
MSELREQLERAKRAYAGQRYPGDLAAEVLGAAPPPGRLRIGARAAAGLVGLMGLAAAVALWVSARPATTPAPPVPGAIAAATLPTSPAGVSLDELSSFPSFPEGMGFAPTGADDVSASIGSMPAMPSVDLNFSSQTNQTSTTRESV